MVLSVVGCVLFPTPQSDGTNGEVSLPCDSTAELGITPTEENNFIYKPKIVWGHEKAIAEATKIINEIKDAEEKKAKSEVRLAAAKEIISDEFTHTYDTETPSSYSSIIDKTVDILRKRGVIQ